MTYFEFLGSGLDLAELRKRFPRNVSRFGVPYFRDSSKLESAFVQYCAQAKLTFRKMSLTEYEPGAQQNGFVYLSVKNDRGLCIDGNLDAFVDPSSGCPGKHDDYCGWGVKQYAAPIVSTKAAPVLERLGICTTWQPRQPVIYLVSEKVASLLMAQQVTGCELIQCRLAGTHSPQPVFQLKVLCRTKAPAWVGTAQSMRHCPTCGAAKSFLITQERTFHRADLHQADFQLCDHYSSENLGQFALRHGGIAIVSARIIDLFVKNGVKGLTRFSTDPPVKFAALRLSS
jgi:hypothetical protein